jgi:hypothetical protein
MMPVVRHPRCNNCHGGLDPLVPYKQGGHMGDLDTSTIEHNSVQTRRIVCQECHSELEGWDTPGEAMFWAGKSTKQICIQFKEMSSGPADFIGHITDEHGGIQFIETAFKGDRALNDMARDIPGDDFGQPFKVDPPPGTQQDLIRHGAEWANTVGARGWTATKECGCEIRESGYVGHVQAHFVVDAGGVLVEETAIAPVYFAIDPAMSDDVPQDYWHSSSGAIHWTSHVSGKCSGDFSGNTPIGPGADENPMATIQFDPEQSPPFFMVSIGPWQDKYYRRGTVLCPDPDKEVPPERVWGFPMHVGMWWLHDPAGMPLVNDGAFLAGSYTKSFGPGTTGTWSWSFRRTGEAAKKP